MKCQVNQVTPVPGQPCHTLLEVNGAGVLSV